MLKIEKIKTKIPVYDLTVEKNSNFYANNILVHNCAEIVQYTDEETTAICTLSSVVLKNYVTEEGEFDYKLLHKNVRKIVRSLNRVIDINKYSTEKGKKGGLEQRSIGIGVQGLADVYFLMDLEFDSEKAKEINTAIFETIYHAAITESNSLCKKGEYEPYAYFKGSPMSEGIFQFDMWPQESVKFSGLWNWDKLKESVKEHGVCNSLFTAQMPVAGSAKITGSYEMTEPAHSSIFNRRVIDGEIMIVNRYLVEDLEKIGIWSEDLKNEIIMNDGSISQINFHKYLNPESKSYEKNIERMEFLRRKYRTIWEIPQKEIINMAADRGVFIDQTQSMNVWFANPTPTKMSSAFMYGHSKGLKTLSYYTRTKAISTGAKHLGIDTESVKKVATNVVSANTETPQVVPQETIVANNSAVIAQQSEPTVTTTPITFKIQTQEDLPQKPEDSEFECFGCSS